MAKFFLMLFSCIVLNTLCGEEAEEVEILQLDILSYEELLNKSPEAVEKLKNALSEKGIVAVKGIPEYKKKARRFIDCSRHFASLPLSEKLMFSPNRLKDSTVGYELGNEKFPRRDGSWMIDDSKSSYYAYVPDRPVNIWPSEGDLKLAYQEIALVMLDTANKVLEVSGIIGENSVISSESNYGMGRMLHYLKQSDLSMENPFWCGAHFDHGLFTALLPAYYYSEDRQVEEPIEAGLFVRKSSQENFKKIVANDPDIMLFQVGEFGQLVSNDALTATEHRVHKAKGQIERFTMALFIAPPPETTIYSKSVLTKDKRFGDDPNASCTYSQWHEATMNRFRVQ